MNETVLGLPFESIQDGTPLSAVLVVKMLSEDGTIMFAVRTTESMTLVEILGMLRYAATQFLPISCGRTNSVQ